MLNLSVTLTATVANVVPAVVLTGAMVQASVAAAAGEMTNACEPAVAVPLVAVIV